MELCIDPTDMVSKPFRALSGMWLQFPLGFSAGHQKQYFDNHSRLNPSLTDYRASKLDVQQRNSYNRTNHNRYHSQQLNSQFQQPLPQVVVADSTITSLAYDNNNHQHGSSHHQHSHQSVPESHQAHNSQYQFIQQNSRYNSSSASNEQPDPYWDDPADSRRFTERRKKTVRFDGQDADDWGRWESERQGSQDSTTKDSGIDTSSTFTSSEDSNRGDGPKNPVSWQVSADGSRMIGHMVLQRNSDSEDVLGLRVRGGQVLPHNEKGAIVEQVQRGSIADQEGHIRPGDEVVEWNGHSMRGKSASNVYDIISASKREPLVELLLTREIAINRKNTQASWRKSHSPTRIQTHRGAENYIRRDKPSVLVTSPGSPDLHSVRNYSTNLRYPNRLTPAATATQQENSVGGRVQLKLGFDPSSLQLIVTILGAKDLVPRVNGAARNPYAKICLLPDRSEKSKRRTKTLALTNEPRWGQTFVYDGLRRADLQNRLFEITVWDYVRYGANDFLGEVILDLSTYPLDDEPEWFNLQPHSENLRDAVQPGNELDMILSPIDHLSPPSTTSRCTDSDTTSECDIDGLMTARDGASVSSSSPPPEVDLQERRSRRDMSPQGRKRVASMVAKDYRTVSGVGQGFHNQMTNEASASYRRNGTMALNQRSQSAAPSDSYRDDRRDSLSPQDDRYTEYPVLPLHQYAPRFQSRSATATPTGSPKKRQLPQVPHVSRNAAMRERFVQEFEERSGGRFSRYRHRQSHHLPTYRSTGMGGWEQRYTGLSDSDLTTHSLDSRIRPRHSLSPDKDFMGDFADSDMESVVSVTSSAFSTQSERPRGSKGIRNTHNRRLQHRSLPSGWATASLCALPSENPFGHPVSEAEQATTLPDVTQPGLNVPSFDVAPDQGFVPSNENLQISSQTPSYSPMAPNSSVVVPSTTEDNRLVPSPAVSTYEQFPILEPASSSYFSKQCITLNPDKSTIQSYVVNPGNDNVMTTSLNVSNISSMEPTSLELQTESLPLSSYMPYSANHMTSSLQGDSFYSNQLPDNNQTNSRTSYVARSNISEPNLNTMNIVRRLPREPKNLRKESICISNQQRPIVKQQMPSAANQIVLKSSFSDQNLPNSFIYEQNNSQTGNICISNVYDPNTGIKNQTITCIRNSMENLGESNIRYSSNQDGTFCEFSAPDLQFRSSVGSLVDVHGISQFPTSMMIANQNQDIRPEDDYNASRLENDLGVEFRNPTKLLMYPSKQPFYGHTEIGFKETYLGNTITNQKDKLNRSHSLISSDQVIDIEYDSDTGYKTKSVRKNLISNRVEENIYRNRTRSLDGHNSLEKEYNDNNSDTIGSKSSLDKSNMTLNIIKITDESQHGNKDKDNNRKTKQQSHMDRTKAEDKKPKQLVKSKSSASPAKKSSKMAKKTSSSNSLNRTGSAKSKASSSKESITKSKVVDKPKFREIDPKQQKSSNQKIDSRSRVDEIKGESEILHSSSESIKSIIDEVRLELLQKPQNFTYLSDESPTFLNRSHSLSDGESSHYRRANEKYDKYEFIEGRKHYILKEDNINRKVDEEKYGLEKSKGYDRSHSVDNRRVTRSNKEAQSKSRNASGDVFTKCRTRSSSVVSNEDRCNDNEDDVSDDDVFESPFSRGRNSSFNGKSSSKRRSRLDTRRTSSLEDIKKFISQQNVDSTCKGSKGDNTRHSSVSINDKPEYFEYTKSPSPLPKYDARNANYASNRSKSSNGIALLQTEPKRTSLKKTPPDGPAAAKSSTPTRKSNSRQHHQSDYDVRDRGRYGNNGGRDTYRQRDRDRNSSDHERDRLSDGRRESRDRAELDRSLSNNEGTPEDKIDGSLSDTAVIQSLDSRRKLDQRSPKSETPTRERDLFGPGMGKKSSSTSQLSATGGHHRYG
ncbi:AAEL000479-PA [Aedes aegypti]|uniref:AAEL000479-PA n=1 Tax=Aedes aegypti TaxID=7159 RepID=Q17P39_AEDAE|nr:AAEL000479-PA [Aedes aegypti]